MSTEDQSRRGAVGTFKEWLTATEIYDAGLFIDRRSSRRTISRFLQKVRETTPLGTHWRTIDRDTQDDLRHGYKETVTEHHYTCLPWSAVILYEIRHRPGGVSEETVRYLESRTLPEPYDHKGRLSTGTFSTSAELLSYLTDLMGREPRPKATEMRRLCVERFGEEVTAWRSKGACRVPMPSLRAFQEFVRPLRMPEGL